MRLLINPRFRGEIEIERIFPGDAGKFFMDKRMKHMRNVAEEVEAEDPKAANDAAKDQQQMANKQVAKDCHGKEKSSNEKARTSKTIADESSAIEEASSCWCSTRRN